MQNNAIARNALNNVRPASIPRTSALAVQAPNRRPAQVTYRAVSLRYLENAPIRMQGHVTGQSYDFSGVHPIRTVDARDAAAFLRSRLFRQL